MPIRIVMLGDMVGRPGRLAVAQQMAVIRQRWQPDLVIANAENAANGSGLTPELFAKLRQSGIDGITMGDHVYKRAQIVPLLESENCIIRPANLPEGAKGKTWMKLDLPPDAQGRPRPSLYVLNVLGRLWMNQPVNDPFAAVERVLGELPEKDPLVLLEVHAEATSEKQALGWQFNGRVAAVVGTHTHVATADERILSYGTAYMTDLGMCGAQESILGRQIDRVLTQMTTAMPTPFDVAEGDPRVCGVFIEVDHRPGGMGSSFRASRIERIELRADPQAPPFTAT